MDGFVKSPCPALRFTFVVAEYLVSTPHSSVSLGAGLRALPRPWRESFLLCHPNFDFLHDRHN
jgi:hypothetical protein